MCRLVFLNIFFLGLHRAEPLPSLHVQCVRSFHWPMCSPHLGPGCWCCMIRRPRRVENERCAVNCYNSIWCLGHVVGGNLMIQSHGGYSRRLDSLDCSCLFTWAFVVPICCSSLSIRRRARHLSWRNLCTGTCMFVAITCEEESSMLSQLHDARGPQVGTFLCVCWKAMVRVAHDVVGGAFGYKMKENEHPSGLVNIWDFIGSLANLLSWSCGRWLCDIHLAIWTCHQRALATTIVCTIDIDMENSIFFCFGMVWLAQNLAKCSSFGSCFSLGLRWRDRQWRQLWWSPFGTTGVGGLCVKWGGPPK